MTRALVIGGTGMLAAAGRMITTHYDETIFAARRPQNLAHALNARALVLDWRDRDGVTATLEKLAHEAPLDLLVSWLHDEGLWCLVHFESLLNRGGRSIRVHSSAVGDPAQGVKTDPAPRADIIRQDVVLGWVEEKNGRRWLTNEEISSGVIHAFENPAKRAYVIGQVK